LGCRQDATRPVLVSAGTIIPFYISLRHSCPLRERAILTECQTPRSLPASEDTQGLKRAQPLRRRGGCGSSEEGPLGPEEEGEEGRPQAQKRRDSEKARHISWQVNHETGVLRGAF
jgi:hypothetical protein